MNIHCKKRLKLEVLLLFTCTRQLMEAITRLGVTYCERMSPELFGPLMDGTFVQAELASEPGIPLTFSLIRYAYRLP